MMKDYTPPYVPTWEFEVVPAVDVQPGFEVNVPLVQWTNFVYWILDWVDRILEKINR